MKKRTRQQWQQIMKAHAEFSGTTKQFCKLHDIHIQTFYSRRHALGLATSTVSKGGKPTALANSSTPLPFVKAQRPVATSHISLHTKDAQLFLPGQCCPVWLATLLKGLSA